MSTPIAYVNGRFLPVEDANLHVFDLGVVGGASVTEMARTFRHIPFRLESHLKRLEASLQFVGIETGLTTDELDEICRRLVAENAQLIPAHHDLGLVVFATAGINPTYVGTCGGATTGKPTVCAHTFPLPFELWGTTYETGLHLAAVYTRSIPDDVIDPRIKHRSRLHWHLASREARRIDPGAVAILSDHDGLLTETATGNLCIVDGSTIMTPVGHVLEGISREYVAELTAALGLEFIYAPIRPDDLDRADEAFLTSTPHCLLPVTRFNQSPIGSGRPGPVFRMLIEAWGQSVGIDVIQQMRQGAVDRAAAAH